MRENVIPAKNLLAITFTNAAANDMKAKILEHLRNIMAGRDDKSQAMMNAVQSVVKISDDELISRAKSMYNDIIHNYSDFNISTIDSFFQIVMRSFAREIGQYASYRVELDQNAVITQVVDRMLDSIEDEINL